jgi:hypothetical protein
MHQPLSLTDLAERANAEHHACLTSIRTALAHATACGEILERIKKLVERGQWLSWVKDNLEFSERTAQVYMRLAKHRDKIEQRIASKPQATAELTIEAAQGLIALSTGYSRTGSGFHIDPEFRAKHRVGERIKQNMLPREKPAVPPEQRNCHDEFRYVICLLWGFIDYFKNCPGNAGFDDVREQMINAISQLDEHADPAEGKAKIKRQPRKHTSEKL